MAQMSHVLGVVNMDGWTAPGRPAVATPTLQPVGVGARDEDIPF